MSESPTRSITIRLDAELFQAMRDAATENSRSMNAEIAQRLTESVAHEESDDLVWLLKQQGLNKKQIENKIKYLELQDELEIIDKETKELIDELKTSQNRAKSLIIKRLGDLDEKKEFINREMNNYNHIKL